MLGCGSMALGCLEAPRDLGVAVLAQVVRHLCSTASWASHNVCAERRNLLNEGGGDREGREGTKGAVNT